MNSTSNLHHFICKYCGTEWYGYFDKMDCKSCGNLLVEGHPVDKDFKTEDKIDIWIKLGLKNPWIAGAYDPPFGRNSFYECKSIEELREKLSSCSWSLGTAFYYKNLCFINQINGGDEWLTIKDDYAFESITFKYYVKNKREFEKLILSMLAAPKEACLNLTYDEYGGTNADL